MIIKNYVVYITEMLISNCFFVCIQYFVEIIKEIGQLFFSYTIFKFNNPNKIKFYNNEEWKSFYISLCRYIFGALIFLFLGYIFIIFLQYYIFKNNKINNK